MSVSALRLRAARLRSHLAERTVAALERTSLGYRFLLSRRGASLRPAAVTAPWMNRALASKDAWRDALGRTRAAGLHPHPDAPKNWDALASLDFILTHTSAEASVLDAGGEVYSPLIEWLYLYGYRTLEVLNLVFTAPFSRGPIRYTPGDCTRTSYADRSFDVVVSLSVIEHGVPLDAFLEESRRILKPGGFLIISTDYWPEGVDTAGRRAYGTDVRIFSRADMERLVQQAVDLGFVPTSDIDYEASERAVHWEQLSLDFTFIVIALRRDVGR